MRIPFTNIRAFALAVPVLFVTSAACNAVLGHDQGTPVEAPAPDAGVEGDATALLEAAPGSDAAGPITTNDACTGDACATPITKPDATGPSACPVSCDGGLCTPLLYAGSQSGASTIAVYQGNVYWTNNLAGTVMIAPADGSAAAHALATAQPHPTGIYVEASGLFWASLGTGNFDGVISRANFDGTNLEKLAEFADGAYRLTGHQGLLYWSQIGNTVSEIIRMETAGLNERTVSKDLPKTPTSLAVDASGLYWTTPATGTISKAPIGCIYANDHDCARTVVMGRTNPIAVAVGDGDLYWAEESAVLTTKTDGTCAGAVCPRPLATNQASPVAIVTVDEELYWANAGTTGQKDGTIMFARRDGSCPTVLATGQTSPGSIAVDGKRVYWLNAGATPTYADGSAQSVPRPGK